MRIVSKKNIYLLMLFVIFLIGLVITPTYAKFASSFATEEDIVGLNLTFNIGISNVEEYEEVRVDANSYQIFNVEITNNSGNTAYYGVWYKMVNPTEINDSILIGRHVNNEVGTSGSINNSDSTITTIIVKNKSNQSMKLNIGVASSTTSTNNIEYLGGKRLISSVLYEEDYFYDDTTSKYISTTDNSIQFTTSSTNYDYTGASQTITTNHDGVYKLEAWGASGGGSTSVGKGAYTSGIISLQKDETLYTYVGGSGSVAGSSSTYVSGGYNGGGSSNYSAGAGGGATDFRVDNTGVSDTISLTSRIMVAAGGGGEGAFTPSAAFGGSGGTLTGIDGGDYNETWAGGGHGGTQIAGGEISTEFTVNETNDVLGTNGSFALGGNGGSAISYAHGSGAGGGGYYGGAGGSGRNGGGAGGSSFISGYIGCDAIKETSTADNIIHTGQSVHYSGKIFKNPTMIAGNANMPTHDGESTMTGNSGNGYAKITSVVPTIFMSNFAVVQGNTYSENSITCINNGSGCKIARISSTSNLEVGIHTISIYIMDDYGYVYRYDKEIKVVDSQTADYYYDESTSKYISTTDNSIQFTSSSTNYDYTGASQTFTVNHDGAYKLEAWGASGGNIRTYTGGKGAYTSGVILLSKNENLYVYVGGAGTNSDTGGYNGGSSLASGQSAYGASGGGASDFRLISGVWNNFSSLKSRIMVAAGGGGANDRNGGDSGYKYGSGNGGAGGTLTGLSGEAVDYQTSGSITTYDRHSTGTGGTQTSGGRNVVYNTTDTIIQNTITGQFGEGNPDPDSGASAQSGGGSGYYGGGTGGHGGAGGGSSYISGYQGSVAITSLEDVTPKPGCVTGTTNIDCSYHYSGKIFTNSTMLAGNASMPTHDGSSTMTGNTGNGYAKITPIIPTITASNLSIHQGKQLTSTSITCNDAGAGCQIIGISDTTSLVVGTYDISIYVMDNYGYVYKYTRSLSVTGSTSYTVVYHGNGGGYGPLSEDTLTSTLNYNVSGTLDSNCFDNKNSEIAKSVSFSDSYTEIVCEPDEDICSEIVHDSLDNPGIPIPARAKFLGWATSPTGAVVYNDQATLLITTPLDNDTLDLYAKWTDNYFITLPSIADRTGYTIDGWYTSDGTRVGGVGDEYSPTGTPITLFAHWIAN